MNATTASIIEFRKILLDWFYPNRRHFEWRKKSISNYQKFIAEVLLQRTKAKTVSTFFSSFIQKYPSWSSIANTTIDELEKTLKPIGLSKQRAPRLHKLGVEMNSRGGRVPKDYQELIKLPIVGQYIANAVLSVIHDKAYPMMDVNMARVLERHFGPRKLADIRYDLYLQELGTILVATKNSRVVNWAILDFASSVCKARNPVCSKCIMKKSCSFARNNS